jgi:hypothetical protein
MAIRRLALITATAAALACPTVAVGQSVPPGSSELDQYVPTAPHSGGNQQAGGQTGDDLGGGGAGGPGAGVGGPPAAGGGGAPSTLGGAPVPGADSSAAAGDGDGIAEPAATARSEYFPGLRPAAHAAEDRVAKGDAGSPVGATLYTLTGGTSGGLGFALPMILGASLALAIVYALRQRRSASGR